MAFMTQATLRGRYSYRAGSCFLKVGDTGREIIPPARSEVGRAVAMSTLAFFSLLQAPFPSYSRPGPPETMLATLDSWLLKKGADQKALAYTTAPDFSQNVRNLSPLWPLFNRHSLGETACGMPWKSLTWVLLLVVAEIAG